MNAKREELTEGERRYLEHVRRARSQGMGLSQYCRSVGLNPFSLYSMRRQMRRKGILAPVQQSARAVAAKEPRASAVPGRFVAVRVVERAVPVSSPFTTHSSSGTINSTYRLGALVPASSGGVWRHICNPHTFRAVALANLANSLPIVVPCHGVIGANAAFTGSGGGLPIKQALPGLERAPSGCPRWCPLVGTVPFVTEKACLALQWPRRACASVRRFGRTWPSV